MTFYWPAPEIVVMQLLSIPLAILIAWTVVKWVIVGFASKAT